MTQFTAEVEKQRLKNEAECWGLKVKDIHCFDTKLYNMGYDTRPGDGKVMDISLNNGAIKREVLATGKIYFLGDMLVGDALVQEYGKQNAS
tara:strand:+ start:6300 stop:6572 length:273 start_codon:yes stop_codon:yes gene_type:complete